MAMDCETCQPTLLDLVHGELDPVLATQVQQHMAGCADCRADMERLATGLDLARQLPVVEPPSGLGERLLELAANHADQVRRARAPKRRSLWQRLLDFTGQFAMTPQVGMATISLLIVAVGLWSVPRLTREPEAAGVTVVNPDPEGQAGPSAGLQPAERLDLAVDTRGKRIRPREDAIELARRADAPQAVASEPVAPPAPVPASPGALPEVQPEAPGAELAEVAHPALDEKASLRSAGAPSSDESPKPTSDFAKRAKAKESESALEYELGAMATADSANAAQGAAPTREAAKGDGFAAAPPPSAATASPAGPADDGLDDRAGAGAAPVQMEALPYRKSAPAKAASVAAPASALKDVRALQASGGCKAAVPGYEKLIAAFPNSAEAGEATLALAACYRSLGQEALARQLLDRALRRPATAARARAMLAPPAADEPLDATQRK